MLNFCVVFLIKLEMNIFINIMLVQTLVVCISDPE
jgi:hypothetical protein